MGSVCAWVVVAVLFAASARAGDLGWLFNGTAAAGRAVHRKPPVTECDPCMDRVINEIDWVGNFLDRYGTIVAKQPDVWGQSRLTRHRQEYEDELRKQLGEFEVRANAAIRRSDQAFLGMAMALEAATDRRRGPEFVQVPDVTSNNNVLATIGSMLPTGNEQVERAGQGVIGRTAPFQMPASPPGMQFESAPISLEPTKQLDQLSRYLNHLHELRRINEGDDIADSPGYSLNLVRVPVSVTPGQLTQKGHGAEIMLSARLVLGEDLLPTTFRNLVINDLVDVISPALMWCVNDRACRRWAATIARSSRMGDGGLAPPAADAGVESAMRSLAARIPTLTPSTAPTVKSRRARMPIPFSQLADTAGVREIAILIHDASVALENHPAARPCIPYVEVRNYLAEELDAAYDFLSEGRQAAIWTDMPEWGLAEAVRGRRVGELARSREGYFAAVGPEVWQTTTAVLGWAILLESAILSERLADDVRESATSRGFSGGIVSRGPFYGPCPSPEARAVFNEYVERRWPIRVFALDPVVQEQNVEDAFARRRELQIAAAMAFASGRMGAQALMRFTRRLEMEMATISLNRTAIGFTHGHDTFGWRFEPRIQPPPSRTTLAAFTETLCGGPSAEAERMHLRLEPGQRECTAIVVMPAFVPVVVFDVESRWYSLVHPADTKPNTRESMLVSRSLKAIEMGVAECQQKAHILRGVELDQLMQRVTRLDRRLPTQTMQTPIPAENTAGGFELLNTGITDLAPELLGWYGAHGVNPDGTTSLFLIGKGFSVHDTSVIAGGRRVPIQLISRELLRADIPPGVGTIKQACRAGRDVLFDAEMPIPFNAQSATRPEHRPLGLSLRERSAAGRVSVPSGTSAGYTDVSPQGAARHPHPGPLPEGEGDLASAVPDRTNEMPVGQVGVVSRVRQAAWRAKRTDAEPSAEAIPAPLPPGEVIEGPIFEEPGGCPDCGEACNDREVVDIHLATPYGVSSRLYVPVVRDEPGSSTSTLAFAEGYRLGLSFTPTKTSGSRTDSAKIDEFYSSDTDVIVIRVPEYFVPPPKGELSCTLSDPATGTIAATFGAGGLPFDARRGGYRLGGNELRNFIGDTSRPATDKTLRGAVKPYVDSLLARGSLGDDGDTVSLRLTATLVAEQQEVPIEGGIIVDVTRRGRTATVEPAAEPRDAVAP